MNRRAKSSQATRSAELHRQLSVSSRSLVMRMVLPGDPCCLNPAYPRQKLPRASAGDDLAKCQPETGTKKIVALEFGKRKFQLPGTLLTRSFLESHLGERQAI